MSKAWSKLESNTNESKEAELDKKFREAEEKYLKTHYRNVGTELVNKYGAELISLYETNGNNIISDGEKVVQMIEDKWKYHTA